MAGLTTHGGSACLSFAMKSILGTAMDGLRTPVPASNGLCMQICLFLDPARIFLWHVWLAEALAGSGRCQVAVEFASERRPLPNVCSLLMELERLVYGLPSESALNQAGERIKPFLRPLKSADIPFDAVIDLAGGGDKPPATRRMLILGFDGLAGELGAIASLIRRHVPAIQVYDSTAPGRIFVARPAVTDCEILAASLDNILSSTTYLLKKAALLEGNAVPQSELAKGMRHHRNASGVMLWGAASVTRKAKRLLKMLVVGGRTWSVAWRSADDRALLRERSGAFNLMRDDGRRYYADPFPFEWQGRTFLFVEEYAYASRRGCISVSEIRKDGTASTPRPVLEEPHHLSYPFVFEHGGQVWMMPESGAARGVYLYRAEAYPFRWKREACLIGDRESYDATLLGQGGALWLFACDRAWNASSWDALTLYSSDRLDGEWQAHVNNPVLLDSSTARPAGAPFRWNGDQMRPVQDCSTGYGRAVSVCRIDALSPQVFAQTVIGRLHCGPHGCHTYNHNRIETIDTFAPRGLERIDAFYDPVFAATDDGPRPAPDRRVWDLATNVTQSRPEMQSRQSPTASGAT
jgi:hypothetical protein